MDRVWVLHEELRLIGVYAPNNRKESRFSGWLVRLFDIDINRTGDRSGTNNQDGKPFQDFISRSDRVDKFQNKKKLREIEWTKAKRGNSISVLCTSYIDRILTKSVDVRLLGYPNFHLVTYTDHG